MTLRQSITACVLVLGTASTTATADTPPADFNFVIPVQLENLHPDIVDGVVLCSLTTTKDNHDDRHSRNASASFAITNRRFVGDVTVRITFPRAQPPKPEDARFYECHLEMGMRINGVKQTVRDYTAMTGQQLITSSTAIAGDLKAVQKLPAGTVAVPKTPPPVQPKK